MKIKTKAEQRVEIAKDVIKYIKAEDIIAGSFYFKISSRKTYNGEQLQSVLPEIKRCEICALGGMFYSYVKRHNNYEVDNGGIHNLTANSMRNAINMFSNKQLQLIESAYEQSDFVSSMEYADSTIIRAIDYREKNDLKFRENHTKALIHIMKNIIANKGTFKP